MRIVVGRALLVRVLVAALLGIVGWQGHALAADAPAGSGITNIASLQYEVDGAQRSVASNPATLRVAERLDLTLAWVGSGPVSLGTGATAVPFLLVNTGNGTEAFQLDATVAAGDSRVRFIAVDGDGDGRFDPADDAPLQGGRTVALAAGESLALLVVMDTAATPAAGTLTLAARAVTGAGPAGTTFAGLGDGGGDAVVGQTGAAASIAVPLATAAEAPTLAKSQSVSAPDGSASAVRGAAVTYTLVARFSGVTDGVVVVDSIPAGTAYVPGSLSIDGTALTDAADTDAGEAGSAAGAERIRVVLGTVAAGTSHLIRFTVIIQ